MSTEFKRIKKKNDEESNSKIKMGENFTNDEKHVSLGPTKKCFK